MRTLILVISLSFFAHINGLFSQSDTTWVQTYTWEEQNNPETAYDSPGRKWFTFPEGDQDYRKILMYYNLKCFEDGTAGDLGFACGEWDYLSYTYLFDHTGLMDSTAGEHPKYLVDNLDFEFANLTSTPVFDYLQQPTFMGSSLEEGNTITVGENETILDNALHEGQIYRTQILYTAEELLAAGVTSGDITGVNFDISVNVNYEQLRKISLLNTSSEELSDFEDGDFQVVYNWFENNQAGNPIDINFSEPFVWDGTSNLLINIEGKQIDFQNILNINNIESTTNSSVAFSVGNDRYLELGTGDNIRVPEEAFETLDEEVSISLWAYGEPDDLPANTYLFEGVDESNNRVLNVHLPWSNSRIYWDAGWDGGYDRIDKAATESEIEGQWNHWVFTKNTGTGSMKIYLNGSLWHSGTNHDNSLAGIVKFLLGSSHSSSAYYFGKIDDFAVFDIELDENTIQEWMKKDITPLHPNYSNLKVYYDFNQATTDPYLDKSSNTFNGIPIGSPERVAYEPNELYKNIQTIVERPITSFFQGNSIDEVIESNVLIPLPVAPSSLTEWYVDGNFIELDNWQFVWINGASTTYDVDGNVLSTENNDLDMYIENEVLEFFNPPFEVIDRYELGRFITPYGINLTLDDDGWTWIFDVTDFAPLLKGEVELQAGNWQELLDMKFAFIHGTAPRDVLDVKNVWNGNFGLTTFDETVTEQSIERLEGEEMYKLKATTTGHGNPGCAEFCDNTHSVKVNGNQEWSWEIMQECADNPLRPQGGTWIYDRAGWCPGAPGKLQEFEITDLVSEQETFTIDYDCEYENQGNYVFEAQLIAYGNPNFENDVELEEILSPNNMKIRSHFNPICNKAKIRIRNTGANDLTSCTISFGIEGNYDTFEWTGNLAFMESEEVELDYSDEQIYAGDTDAILDFEVTVGNPNQVMDENEMNNYGVSKFQRPPVYTYGEGDDDENELVIYLQTNLFPNETTYTLYDDDNNEVFSRDVFPEALTAYRDTVQLNRGCYLFHLEDSDDDGISFWADDDGNGDVRLRKVTAGQFKAFGDDFGKEIYHYFYWDTDLVNVDEQASIPLPQLQVYPNPSEGIFNLKFKNFDHRLNIEVYDVNGQIVHEEVFRNPGDRAMKSINLKGLSNGMYSLRVLDGKEAVTRRIIIQ